MKLFLLVVLSIVTANIYAQNLSISELGRYTDGRKGACEISTYDSTTSQLITTNGKTDSIDIIDVSNAAAPVYQTGIDVTPYGGGGINSVVNVGNGYFAAAIAATVEQDSGSIVFFDMSGAYVADVKVGALPDMVTVTKDGNKVLVACEGEPNDAYTVDPEGTIVLIDISGGVTGVSAANVNFLHFNNAPTTIAGSIKKPGTTYAEDLEPEYIAVNDNSTLAAVVCQENNVLVLVDLTGDSILTYKGLGFKDHSVAGNGFDASNSDGKINITLHNVKGVYQPDAIAAYMISGNTYFISANEGDARDYGGYSSETRIKNLSLDSTAFPMADSLQADSVLGRLKTFTADMLGDIDGDGDVDELYSYGARSFSIWDENGNLIWDSGDAIEQYMATNHANFFNCNNGLASKKDSRSDDKGAEPEAVVIGKIGNKHYAFIGLERQGGILVYDVTDPNSPVFETFLNSFDNGTGTMTDIAPEGLVFIPASESHNNKNMLIVSNEVSGTTTIYEIVDLLSSTNKVAFENAVNVYPNPTSSLLNVEFKERPVTAVTYRIVNAIGQEVRKGMFNDSTTTIYLSDLSNGVYYMTLENTENAAVVLPKKIIKS